MTTPFKHNDPYTVERCLKRNLNNGAITAEDADIIRQYIHWRAVTAAISRVRQAKLASIICGLQKLDPKCPIKDLTVGTIYDKIQTLHSSEYSQNTKHDMIIIGKGFWKYLSDNGTIDADVKQIRAIKSIPVNPDTTTPDEILTIEEISELIKCGGSAKNRAIISVLYESACRISELATLKWKDVFFDEHGAKLYIHDHKTNKQRYCRLIISVSHLIEWRNDYGMTASATGDNLVFITSKGESISYAGYVKILNRAVQRSGITKNVHLHLLRKSRITHMVRENYQESIIKQIAWGNLNTSMMQTYVRLSESDIDSELLDHMGIVSKAEDASSMKPTRCIRCGAIIGPDQKYCSHCGLSKDADLTDAALSSDPELVMRILQILQSQKE